MKPLFKLLFILLGLSCSNLHAQTFSTLSESERNAKLIEVAKERDKEPRFINFYREYGIPTIKTINIEGDTVENNPLSKHYGKDLGNLIYVVIFHYDETIETMEWDYAAKVFISDKLGVAFDIQLGNGMGIELELQGNVEQ